MITHYGCNFITLPDQGQNQKRTPRTNFLIKEQISNNLEEVEKSTITIQLFMNKFTNEEKGIEELILHLSATATTNPNQTIYRKSKSQKKLNQKTKAL